MLLPSEQYCEFIWGQQSIHLSVSGLPGPHCPLCLCQGARGLAWLLMLVGLGLGPQQLSCWERGRLLSGSRRHDCPNSFHHYRSTSPNLLPSLVRPPLLYHYFPWKSIPASLMLLPLILGPATFDFTGGAEKPWANSGQTLLHVWPLETLDLLGYLRDCCVPEKQMKYKALQWKYELWTILLISSISGKV